MIAEIIKKVAMSPSLLEKEKILVRCKDCTESKKTKRLNGEEIRNCPLLCMDVSDYFYCGYGIAKDGEQE